MGSRHKTEVKIAESSASQNGNLGCSEPWEKNGRATAMSGEAANLLP